MQRVNEALGTLAKASKDKSVDLKSLGKIISRASQDVESLRHTFAALPRDQAHSKVLTIAKASSSLCGLLVDLKAFSYAQTELQRLSYSLRAWLQVDGPAEEDALVSHMIIPLPQDTSSLTSEIVTLVISTQFQIFATLLRPADTKTDWRDLAGSLVKQTTLQGHLLHWRTFLIDQDTLTSTDTKLQRIDQYLNNLFTLVLKAATGIDSSSSSALYDPDTLLQLRLYAVHCALATPNLSAPAQQQVVHARREAFWDQLRRAVGLYQRSVSSLKCTFLLSSEERHVEPDCGGHSPYRH